jgi:hypothetical protein
VCSAISPTRFASSPTLSVSASMPSASASIRAVSASTLREVRYAFVALHLHGRHELNGLRQGFVAFREAVETFVDGHGYTSRRLLHASVPPDSAAPASL